LTSPLGGYAGQYIRINLTNKSFVKEKISASILRTYLGGKGLGAYLLFKELRRGVPPLSPENKLIIMTGPLTGTPAPAACKFAICTKSPLTGAWLDTLASGYWGPELKFAGYDGIVVEGRAEKPVYILISNQEVSFLDASDIWGMNTLSTINTLRERHLTDRIPRVLAIGPAGERGALIANIIADERACGRGGAGAVMGSKKLKAIVVVGHSSINLAEPDAFEEARKRALKKISKHNFARSLREEGTCTNLLIVNEAGGLPTRNFQSGRFEHAEEVSGGAFKEDLWLRGKRRKGCFNCSIICSHISVIEEGKWAGFSSRGPEYETVYAFGPQCGVCDRRTIALAGYLCDLYGIDTISCGNTIGFLMECAEKGLISKEKMDGVDLKFGDPEVLIEAVMRAGSLTGNLGKLIAHGVKRASEAIGKGSEKFAMHVKGLELPAYDPRAGFAQGLAFATADRGGDHIRPFAFEPVLNLDPFTIDGKAEFVKRRREVKFTIDSVGVCYFVMASRMLDFNEDLLVMLNAATGFNLTPEEFIKIGERINNLTRAFNVREGLDRKDDTLPWRLLNEPAPEGPCKGKTVPLNSLLEQYYKVSGWDERGWPTKETLERLGLDFVVQELYPS